MLSRLFAMAVLALGVTAHGPPVYAPPVYAPPAYGSQHTVSMACQCDTTTTFAFDSLGSARLFLTVNPKTSANWLTAVNPAFPADVSFLCDCRPNPVTPTGKTKSYILTANQTDVSAPPAPDCLGIELLKDICVGLGALSLFQCETVWRSGVAGTAADNLHDLEALLLAVEKLCAARGGGCTRTLVFQLIVDAALAPSDY